MKQRHVERCIVGVLFLAVLIVIGAFALMDAIHHDRPKFVEPVIWHVPHTGGAPQYEPEI